MGRLKDLKAKAMAKVTTEIMSLEWTAKEKRILSVVAGGTTALASATGCYAATDIETKLKDLLKEAYGVIFGVSTGIAIVFAAWHLVCMMTSGDPQTTRGHVQAMKKIAAAWLVLNCLGIIASTAANLVSGSDYRW